MIKSFLSNGILKNTYFLLMVVYNYFTFLNFFFNNIFIQGSEGNL